MLCSCHLGILLILHKNVCFGGETYWVKHVLGAWSTVQLLLTPADELWACSLHLVPQVGPPSPGYLPPLQV